MNIFTLIFCPVQTILQAETLFKVTFQSSFYKSE